jgi:hypothetical protein
VLSTSLLPVYRCVQVALNLRRTGLDPVYCATPTSTGGARYLLPRPCSALSVSSSGYYAWRHRSPSLRQQANEVLLIHMRQIHQEVRQVYGSPRMTDALHDRGFSCSKPHLGQQLVLDAWAMACRRYPPIRGLIFHSDQGKQCASKAVRKALKQVGCLPHEPKRQLLG